MITLKFPYISLLALVAVVAVACGVPTASPQASPRVNLVTNVSPTKYYTVYGTTTEEILASIKAKGPQDSSGKPGSGLAESNIKFDGSNRTARGSCAISLMTITLDLTITLPVLDNPNMVSASVLRKWERFAAEVANHEQRHVDIYLGGAERLRQAIEAIGPKPTCPSLDDEIQRVWMSEDRLIDNEQENFHAAEELRLAALRAPLQSQLDASKAQLDALNSEITTLESALSSLESRADSLSRQLDALEAQMRAIEAMYPTLILPGSVYTRYESLQLSSRLVVDFKQNSIQRYNSTLASLKVLAREHDRLLEETNQLVEELNWIQ